MLSQTLKTILKYILSSFFVFIFNFNSNAQYEIFETPSPVYKACVSNDSLYLAFVDNEAVYITELKDFKLLNTISYDASKRGMVSEMFFVPSNSNTLCVRFSLFNNDFTPMPFYEYPNDSLVFLDVKSGNKVTAFAGNINAAFSHQAEHFVLAYNDYFSYDYEGKKVFSAKKGAWMKFPEKNEIPASGIIKSMCVSSDNKLLALAYYDSLYKGNAYYSLEIIDLENNNVIARKGLIEGKPSSITFSEDRQFIFFEKEKLFNAGIEILKVGDLSKPSKEDKINVRFRINDNTLAGLKDNEAVGLDLISGKELWTVWPNITKLFSFNGVFLLSENEIVVYGSAVKDHKDTDEWGVMKRSGGIEKVNLSQLEIFVKNEVSSGIDTLFDAQSFFIQDNTFNDGTLTISNRGDVLLSAANTIGKGSSLQVWSTKQRRKLRDFYFTNTAKAFADFSESSLLVFENYEQINYNDYKIHIINLNSGIAQYIIIKDAPYGFFDATYNCDCFALKDEDAAWICNDGSASLWKITNDNPEPVNILSLISDNKESDVSLRHFVHHSDKNLLIFNVMHTADKYKGNYADVSYTYDSTVVFDMSTFEALKIEGIDFSKQNVRLDTEHYALIYENKVEIKNLNSEATIFSLPLEKETLLSVRLIENKVYFVSQRNGNSTDSLIFNCLDMNKKEIITSFKIPYTANYYISDKSVIFTSGNEIVTYIIPDNLFLRWNQSHFSYLSKNSFSLDGSGHLLYAKTHLIDLSTLDNLVEIPSFNNAVLLKGAYAGKVLYVKMNIYNNEKPNYKFIIAPADNYEEFLWESQPYYLKNESYYMSFECEVSEKGNFAVVYTKENFSQKKDLAHLINFKTKEIFDLEFSKIYDITFSHDESYLYISYGIKGSETAVHALYSTANAKLDMTLDNAISDFCMNDNTFIVKGMYGIDVMEIDGKVLKFKNTYYARDMISVAVYLKSKKMYAAGTYSGFLYIWQNGLQSPVKKIRCGGSEVLKIEESGGKLFVFLKSGDIKIVDTASFLEVASLRTDKKEKGYSFFWHTSEGYFKASKQDIRQFHFVKGNQAYPLISYEAFLNRPDKLLSALGYASQEKLELYHAAYLKRLSRLKIKEGSGFGYQFFEEVQIADAHNIPSVTDKEFIQFKVKLNNTIKKADKLHVFANGVPVYGVNGISLAGLKGENIDLKINLHKAENKVSVFVSDTNGVESLPASFDIISTTKAEEKMYYIGVGVSDYLDSTMSLRFADYDVHRLRDFFTELYNERCIAHICTNEEVTADKLKTLKKILLETTENDMVVISFSGHGLLDKNLDFYFATHDMDFKNPAEKGFSFNEIQWLLDSIPARRKLLLMDACHSGEVDKEGQIKFLADTDRNVSEFRPKGAEVIEDEEGIGLQNSFTLMQNMFNDFNRGNGAFVISAAGGKEYAFETEGYGGVFTYSFISAFYELKGWGGDKPVKISDLQGKVYEKVFELTKGRQKPTNRSDNIEWDWAF